MKRPTRPGYLKPPGPKGLPLYIGIEAMVHTPQDFQIRIRDENQERVIEAIQFYLTDRHMIFNHRLPNNNHYHIYIFGLYRNSDAIRERLKRLGYKKEQYAVSVTAGKKKDKIDPEKAYVYASNPDSNPVVVDIKGFSDEELEQFESAKKRYYEKPIVVQPSDSILPEVVFKVDRVWERLKNKQDTYKGLTVKAIKSKITAEWLNDGKAMPRPSDLHRYAVSIYLNMKYPDGVPDDAAIKDGFFE